MQQMQIDWIEARASLMGVPAVLADGAELDVLKLQTHKTQRLQISRSSRRRVFATL